MIKCENCKKECGDDAAFCPYCGTPIGPKTCRNCGVRLLDDALFCHKCGYPVNGNVCAACGKENDDDALFCTYCGKPLTATKPQVANSAPASRVQASNATKPKSTSVTKEKVFTLTRMIVLPCLLALIFLSSFFGMFKMHVPIYGIDAEVTGFDAVRGMFLLIDPPDLKELQDDFATYLEENFAEEVEEAKTEAAQKRVLKKVIERYGAIKLSVCEESMSSNLKAQVLLYGLHALLLMLGSLILFILSLCHMIKSLMNRDWKIWRGETMSLSLLTAFAFAFLITGGSLAAASWGIFFMGLLGLSFIVVTKIYIQKEPKHAPLVAIRSGVCAFLVILTSFFISGAALNIRLDPIVANVHPNDLYACMDPAEEATSSDAYTFLHQYIQDNKELSNKDKAEMLRLYGYPAMIFSIEDVFGLYDAPATAVAWLLFAFRLAFAAALIALLFGELQADANPTEKRKGLLLRYGLLFAATCGAFGSTLTFAIMANAVVRDCKLAFDYSICGIQIAALIFSAAAFVTCIVFKALEKRKIQTVNEAPAPQPTETESDAEQPTETEADLQQPTTKNE